MEFIKATQAAVNAGTREPESISEPNIVQFGNKHPKLINHVSNLIGKHSSDGKTSVTIENADELLATMPVASDMDIDLQNLFDVLEALYPLNKYNKTDNPHVKESYHNLISAYVSIVKDVYAGLTHFLEYHGYQCKLEVDNDDEPHIYSFTYTISWQHV